MVYGIKSFRKVTQKSTKLTSSMNSFLKQLETMLCTLTFPKALLAWKKCIFKMMSWLYKIFSYTLENFESILTGLYFFVAFTVFLIKWDKFSMFQFLRKFTFTNTAAEVFVYKFSKYPNSL